MAYVMVLLQNGELPCSAPGPLEFIIRGGGALLIPPEDKTITYAISKRPPPHDEIKNRTSVRLDRQIDYLREQLIGNPQLAIERFGLNREGQRPANAEPFALVHRHNPDATGY